MLGRWKDEEVKSLFKEVEKTKGKGKSIKEAFFNHAQKFSRKQNSVRNYYYREVDNLLKDAKRLKDLGINISKHQKQEVKFFGENEGEKIVEEINKLVRKGDSVRQACLKLSGGNVALMLRYQNKYRNQSVKGDDKQKFVNILDFKNRQKVLTDSDLNGLFMGLLKLLKKNAYEEALQSVKAERESMGYLLKKTIESLNKREKEICDLKDEIEKLSNSNKLKNKLEKFKLKQTEIAN